MYPDQHLSDADQQPCLRDQERALSQSKHRRDTAWTLSGTRHTDSRDGILGHQLNKKLKSFAPCNSQSLLLAYFKKTTLFSGFKNPYQKIRETRKIVIIFLLLLFFFCVFVYSSSVIVVVLFNFIIGNGVKKNHKNRDVCHV
jgi:hypothetical protein